MKSQKHLIARAGWRCDECKFPNNIKLNKWKLIRKNRNMPKTKCTPEFDYFCYSLSLPKKGNFFPFFPLLCSWLFFDLVSSLFHSRDKNYQHLNCKCKYYLTTFYYALWNNAAPVRVVVFVVTEEGKHITESHFRVGSAMLSWQILKSWCFWVFPAAFFWFQCVTEARGHFIWQRKNWKKRKKRKLLFFVKRNFQHV